MVLTLIACFRQLIPLGVSFLPSARSQPMRVCISLRVVAFRFAGLLVSLLPVVAVAQDGMQLFHKMQSALGGRNKIAAIEDLQECVRADAWDDEGRFHGEVYKRTRWIRPNVLRLDQIGSGNSYVTYFDGKAGWQILPDEGFLQLAGDELDFARGYLNGLDVKVWLADGDANNIFSSPAPNVIRLSTKDDDSSKTEITLNPKTFLPEQAAVVSMSRKSHSVITRTRTFEEWRAFQGVMFPQRIINFHGDTKVADIRLKELKLDSGMRTDDLAVRPEGLKPDVSQCGR